MSYVQLIEPNLSAVGRLGYCLEYAENVCGAPHIEPSAWQAWLNTQFKHPDSNFPDVICVQWYDYWTGGQQLGHVTINVPGKGIYSSPWQSGTNHAVLPSVAEVERIYGVKYVGWSEDISSLRVIKENDMDPAVLADFQNWKAYGMRVQNSLHDAGIPDDAAELDPALKDLVGWKKDGIQYQAQVDQLTKANLKLTAQLQTQPADPSITVTQTGLWAAFKKFLGL